MIRHKQPTWACIRCDADTTAGVLCQTCVAAEALSDDVERILNPPEPSEA